MKGLYHSGIPNDVASKEAAKIKTLINELDRRVCMLESAIAREEEHAGASDPINAAYPVPARTLTAHRENLRRTILTLRPRLPPEVTLSI